jgi:hypothetical protein
MNKHIIADMVIEKLKKEIGIVPKPFPQELRILEAEVPPPEETLPGGKMRLEASLYQADKIKKIGIIKNNLGEISAGSVLTIVSEDEYEFPFIAVDVFFLSGEKSKIFTEFNANPLVKDEESLREYTPFQKWLEEIGKLPSEPIAGLPEPGEFLKNCLSTIHYLRYIPAEHIDQLLKLTDRFFDIFISIYRKAEPVKDIQRRKKMDTFRSDYNRCVLDEDPSGGMLINAFGREKAKLFYQHILNL